MQLAHFIVEQHPDGFIAYPLGVVGVVIGEGETSADALEDARSALSFHIETFGDDKLASSWLKSNTLLLGMSPNTWLKLERDADEIKRILNAICYGGVV